MNEVQPIVGFLDAPDKEKRHHQMELERLYNKNQTLKRIRSEFEDCKTFNFDRYFRFKQIPSEFGYDLLVQMALHKRVNLPTLVGILRRHFEPEETACQQAADMLVVAAQADLVDWDNTLAMFIVKITISDDVQADLDRFQYPLPMVVPPRSVRDNKDTGYFTSRNSIILRKNHHDDDVCLDHINRVNKVRFSIDYDTARMIKNQWRNLDRPKPGESTSDFDKRKKAFEKYDRTAKVVIDHLLQYGNEFYLTHKYDKRGRIYCQGYHVNYQGAAWNKAVIELADKEFVD
jgi:hypothetical protein